MQLSNYRVVAKAVEYFRKNCWQRSICFVFVSGIYSKLRKDHYQKPDSNFDNILSKDTKSRFCRILLRAAFATLDKYHKYHNNVKKSSVLTFLWFLAQHPNLELKRQIFKWSSDIYKELYSPYIRNTSAEDLVLKLSVGDL